MGAARKTAKKTTRSTSAKRDDKANADCVRLFGQDVRLDELRKVRERGGRREPHVLTAEKKTEFIAAMRDRALTVSEAADEIGFTISYMYRIRREDPEFAAAWDEAIKDSIHILEREATRRAVHGVEEPVFYQGKLVGRVRKYSDVLLIFLMKAANPGKYRDKVDVTNSDGSIANAFAAAVRKAAEA